MNSYQNYPLLYDVSLNLYKAVLYNSLCLSNGYIGIVHDRGIYSDRQGDTLREYLYNRLEYLFRFNNELKLFSGVGNAKKFEISILGSSPKPNVEFYSISNLYHPLTIETSLAIENDIIIGCKNQNGNWDLRGNKGRVLLINQEVLNFVRDNFDANSNTHAPILPYYHSSNMYILHTTLLKSGNKLQNVGSLILKDCGQMLNENSEYVIKKPGLYDENYFTLNGPNFYVGNPYFQSPNLTAKNHRDYTKIELCNIKENYIPYSIYKLITKEGLFIPYRYYHAHRRRAINTNERTLISSMIPPSTIHMRSCYSVHFDNELDMLRFHALSLSVVHDFLVRSTGKEDITWEVIKNLPCPPKIYKPLIKRVLLLECLTSSYKAIYDKYFKLVEMKDPFCKDDLRLKKIDECSFVWNVDSPLRNDLERRQALVEIDVLSAILLGLNLEQLISLYKIEFSVLNSIESKQYFDELGMLIGFNAAQNKNIKTCFDRVDDYREAWNYFQSLITEAGNDIYI